MQSSRVIRTLVALLSAGWLVPSWLGVDSCLSFMKSETWPLLSGKQPLNSFPFLEFSSNCLMIAFVWLAVVLLSWSYLAFTALTRKAQN